jgi:hypothetical protein
MNLILQLNENVNMMKKKNKKITALSKRALSCHTVLVFFDLCWKCLEQYCPTHSPHVANSCLHVVANDAFSKTLLFDNIDL